MKSFGKTSVYELLGDFIVYRNLSPLDVRLPALPGIRSQLNIPAGVTPRKSEKAYAGVIVELLNAARAVDAPGSIERLIYLGDTRLNDGVAFTNIARAGQWPGMAFIGSEKGDEPEIEIVKNENTTLYLSNRWGAVGDFDRYRNQNGFLVDEMTAVIVDLDKTALGARGRNDHVIDQARVEAVRRTVGELLGDEFDPVGFKAAYDHLNQPEFHPFTTDNQDYLAFICLILGSGLMELEELVDQIHSGRMAGFFQFIESVDRRAAELAVNLRAIHKDVYTRVKQGDPTPFKTFRYNEFQATVERMGFLDDNAPVEEMLEKEIVITREIQQVVMEWKAQGALLFGLSDKPDEASIPTADLAESGYLPIHRVMSHIVGSS
ncbi:MAG: hypothetical protein JXA42_17245 [Anaerolineales bacterium]|nr:hypothetical protein [Anaerolineales bacterium]